MSFPTNVPYAGSYSQPPPPKKQSFWSSPLGVVTIVGLSVAGLIVFCVGALAVTSFTDRNTPPPASSKMKVEITSCSFTGSDSLPSATVGLSVTNTGTKTGSATVHIEYRDAAGRRVDTDDAWIRDIKPGQTVRHDEPTLLNADPGPSGKCVVTGVD